MIQLMMFDFWITSITAVVAGAAPGDDDAWLPLIVAGEQRTVTVFT